LQRRIDGLPEKFNDKRLVFFKKRSDTVEKRNNTNFNKFNSLLIGTEIIFFEEFKIKKGEGILV